MSSPNMKPIATTPFIIVPYPEREGLSSEQRTVVHSYAARTAHARVRLARVKAYQLLKATEFQQEQPLHPREDERSVKKTPSRPDVGRELDTPAVLISNSGPGGLGSGRGDPFVSFVRPLTNMDQFLLDQCEWSEARSFTHGQQTNRLTMLGRCDNGLPISPRTLCQV